MGVLKLAARLAFVQLAFTGIAQAQSDEPPPAQPQAQQAPKDAIFPTLTVASEYRYDGQSSSSGEPVAQLSLYWWRPDHFYAGVFVTQVDYTGFFDPDTSYEVDLYGGYNWDIGPPYFEMGGDATRISAEVMATFFPDQGPPGPTYDFVQFKLSAQHRRGPLTLRVEAASTPEALYAGGSSWKAETGARYALTDWLTLGGEYGYRQSGRNADRSWWDFGATATFGQIDLDLRYYDTDLDFVECGFSNNCKPALVGAISWNPWKG